MRFGFDGWLRALTVAVAHGWEPMGTSPPRDEPNWKSRSWDYAGNENQLVWARDARKLAAALERAIEGPPLSRKEQLSNLRKWLATPRGKETVGSLIDMSEFVGWLDGSLNRRSAGKGKGKGKRRKRPTVDPLPPLNDYEREYFAEFIEFCREGSFRIC